MRNYQSETAKALKNNNVKAVEGNKFTGIVRQLTLETLKKGDIVEIPTDYTVLEQKMRGSENTAQYIYVNVYRAGKTDPTPVAFYPSSLWKSRQAYDEASKTLGEWKRSNGAVVNFVQEYDDVDEAIRAIAAHGKFTVKDAENITVLRFGEEVGGKTQKTNILTFEWA